MHAENNDDDDNDSISNHNNIKIINNDCFVRWWGGWWTDLLRFRIMTAGWKEKLKITSWQMTNFTVCAKKNINLSSLNCNSENNNVYEKYWIDATLLVLRKILFFSSNKMTEKNHKKNYYYKSCMPWQLTFVKIFFLPFLITFLYICRNTINE